jgi:hypothetical protein
LPIPRRVNFASTTLEPSLIFFFFSSCLLILWRNKTTCIVIVAYPSSSSTISHQGSWSGVGSSSPRTAGAVPMSRGPLGAQYWPVLLMSSSAVHSIRLLAASSGGTAASGGFKRWLFHCLFSLLYGVTGNFLAGKGRRE